MSLKAIRTSAIALAAAMSAGAAGAAPTTWTFTGTIFAEQIGAAWVSNSIGKTVTGTLTIDLGLLNEAGTDDKTYRNGFTYFRYPLLTSIPVYGNATGGALNITVGGGPHDYIYANVNKGSANTWEGVTTYTDSYGIAANSCSTVTLGPCNSISLSTSIFTDGVHASGIFGNATYDHPDLSFDQRVNMLSSGASSNGVIFDGTTAEYFTLTSVIQSAVPEPSGVTLFGLGLSALTLLARRRKMS